MMATTRDETIFTIRDLVSASGSECRWIEPLGEIQGTSGERTRRVSEDAGLWNR
jgi:hypothetical protein